MRVLFLHSNYQDYLVDGLFHGLRCLLGSNCVDVPRHDSMYKPLPDGIRSRLRGLGFTLYGLLDDEPRLDEARFSWRLELQTYDLVVIADVWLQWPLLFELQLQLPPQRIAVIDASDSPARFPYGALRWLASRLPQCLFVRLSQIRYFKRELMTDEAAYGRFGVLPHVLRRLLPLPKQVTPISFSIPEEKIARVNPRDKMKDFPRHIVDPDVASKLPGAFFSQVGSDEYTFVSEADYYADLRSARFGITTKRAGWDCLRHYELAANGCVPCFKDLDLKPPTCAPHGLNDGNCIIYRDYEDLRRKLDLGESDYKQLQAASYAWVTRNTTIERAKQFLDACETRV